MMYLDVWSSGTFLLYSCKAAFWIQETSPRLSDVDRSVVLRSVFAIGSALTYLLFLQECATPPHVQVHHTTWPSFTSDKRWGEKAWVQGYASSTHKLEWLYQSWLDCGDCLYSTNSLKTFTEKNNGYNQYSHWQVRCQDKYRQVDWRLA